MSQFIFNKPIEHLPKPVEFQASITDMFGWLSPLCLQKQYLWDNNYWYISLIDWGKVLKDVCFGMPKYTADKFDCENYAMLCSAKVSQKYKLNTCGIAIGDSPMGWHGYNVFLSITLMKMTLDILEPQTGLVYHSDENSGYIPRLVIFGG